MSTFQFDLSASLRNQSVTKIVTRTRCDTKIHTPWESYWSTALQRIAVVNYAQPVRSSRPRFISFWSSRCRVLSHQSSPKQDLYHSEAPRCRILSHQNSPKKNLYYSEAPRCRVLSLRALPNGIYTILQLTYVVFCRTRVILCMDSSYII